LTCSGAWATAGDEEGDAAAEGGDAKAGDGDATAPGDATSDAGDGDAEAAWAAGEASVLAGADVAATFAGAGPADEQAAASADAPPSTSVIRNERRDIPRALTSSIIELPPTPIVLLPERGPPGAIG